VEGGRGQLPVNGAVRVARAPRAVYAREDGTRRKLEEVNKYFKDQEDSLEEIIPKLREDAEYKFKGKLGEIQDQWAKLTEERKEKEAAYQELRRAVGRETALASKSVMRQVEIEKFNGNVAVTEMLLNLKPRDGAELPFKVTLRKYDLSDPESDRIEPARWIIADIEGATPEAQASVAAAAKASESAKESAAAAKPAEVAEEQPAAAAASKPSARKESAYEPREARGQAKVQILAPETKVQGDEVVSTLRVRNVSKDWITRFTVTEDWYDQQGNAVRGGSQTHQSRFMPGEVIEIVLRTRKNPQFYQNQFKFSHANGEVNATTVGSFPKQTQE
jgi:hypothetical protein